MSATEIPFTPAQERETEAFLRGRAIRLLRTRDWRDDKIAVAFGITRGEVERLAEAATPFWTPERIVEATMEFFRRHNRWPRAREFRNANGLPSHNTVGPILADNFRRSAWRRGRRLTTEEILWWPRLQMLIANHQRCTARMALTLPNQTARARAMARVNVEGTIRQIGIKRSADKFGILWELPGESKGTPTVMVEVINSTAEPDGSFHHHFLRVPPNMTTPQQAVAWTFGVTGREWRHFGFEAET